MPSIPSKTFLSDNETAVDLLYYEAIAKAVAGLLREDRATPITVGVHGDWGAGKSSVLKMVEVDLSKDARTLCLWFNGWAFEGFEDAKTVVLEKIVAELKRARPTSQKVKDAAKKVFKRIQWLKVAKKAGGLAFTAVTGLPGPELVASLIEKITNVAQNPGEIDAETLKSLGEEASGFLEASDPSEDTVPEQIHAFRKEFAELLDAAELDQLVVLVDDLDRCLPETAISTLEAIRLFLFVPRTAFVIGADEAMIEYSVRRHFPDLTASTGTANYARNYLEKLIHVPFRIPALGFAETRAYITLLLALNALGESDADFKKLMLAARDDLKRPWLSRGLDESVVQKALGRVPPSVVEALRTSAQLTGPLTEGTRGNPRQIKRFLNSMSLRRSIAKERGFESDIEVPVLAKLMLAERFVPDLYSSLARLSMAAVDGKAEGLTQLEQIAAGTEAKSGGGKAKPYADVDAPYLEMWRKDQAVLDWAKVQPLIGDKDLRPYMFVTRDKRSFYGAAPVVDHLEPILDRLMGSALSVKSVAPELSKLQAPDAQQLFDVLRQRVQTTDSLSKEPAGFKGLVSLVRARAELQSTFAEMLREFPIGQIGAWAAAGSAEAFTEDAAKKAFKGLLQQWRASENVPLKKAAEMLLQVRAG